MLQLLRTFRRSDISVKIDELEPILQLLQLSGLFCGKPPRENAAMDPAFVIYRGVAGVNVAMPFSHGLTQPDVVTHEWKGGSVSLGCHDFLQQQDGFRPTNTSDGGHVTFPRLWVRIQCPSWSHREKRAKGAVRHSMSGGALQTTAEAAESVSSSLGLGPLPEGYSPVGSSSLKIPQSQDDGDIPSGRQHSSRRLSDVANISGHEMIDHKVICAVISGHMHHGIRVGHRERGSIYDIEDLNNQCGDAVFIGGTPTEIEFQLQLTAQAPNHCGICQCRLAVLPAGTAGSLAEQDHLLGIIFNASYEEPLRFHIASTHFDSNSSYSVEMNWVLRPHAGS